MELTKSYTRVAAKPMPGFSTEGTVTWNVTYDQGRWKGKSRIFQVDPSYSEEQVVQLAREKLRGAKITGVQRLASRNAAGENVYQGRPFQIVKKGGKNSRILVEGESESRLVPNHELWPGEYVAPDAGKAPRGRSPGGTRRPGRRRRQRGQEPSYATKRKKQLETLEQLPPDAPPEWGQPQPRGEDQEAWKGNTRTTLKRAKEILKAKGFKQDGSHGAQHTHATIYQWRNPYTGQLANLKHTTSDKRGRKLDQAEIAYHIMKQNRLKPRTPEQKARDNFVLYD